MTWIPFAWYGVGVLGAWASIAAFRCGGLAGQWTRGQVLLVALMAFLGPLALFMSVVWWICALFENKDTAMGRWWNKPL